jgi:methionyl aminopeptidase
VIVTKTRRELQIMRRAGSILAEVLAEVVAEVGPGVATSHLERVCEAAILRRGGRPSFKGYRGFPAALCVSVNDEVVHGIPGPRRLREGDIVSLDFGVFLDGYHADAALTVAVGEVGEEAKKLLAATERALAAGILECVPGKRVGDVSHAIQVVAEAAGFSPVREYVGHGIGRELHEDPPVPNYGPPGRGPLLVEGMTLAVEPMVNAGGWETTVLEDGWTVVSRDGSLSAHFEHTVAVTQDGPWVLTLPEGEELEDWLRRVA